MLMNMMSTLSDFILTISNVQSVLLLATALFLAQIMKYVQKTTDEVIDILREKYFDNRLSRRSCYNLIWIGMFLIGYFLSPLTETDSRLIFSLFFALFVGYLCACFLTFFMSVYLFFYDILSAFAMFNVDKGDSEVQTKRDDLKNEQHRQ